MSKVKVHLWSGLRAFTNDASVVEVEAKTVGQLYSALARAYPGLEEIIDDGEGVSISIDGEIVPDSLVEPVRPDQEIYLLQKLKGG